MDVQQAIELCYQEFPNGLEVIAQELNAQIIYSDLDNCDGWCVRHTSGSATIRINSNSSKARQKSTLAHELGHLLDGSKTQIYSKYTENELIAFEIGGNLLLPPKKTEELTLEIPLSPRSLKHLADKAGISQLMAARQFAKIATKLGCESVAIVGFKDGKPNWFPLKSFDGVNDIALQVQAITNLKKKIIARFENYIGFVIEGSSNSKILIQKLKHNTEQTTTLTEKIHSFQKNAFKSKTDFQSFQGKLGAFKNTLKNLHELTSEQIVELFLEKYQGRWEEDFETVLNSDVGIEYLNIRFKKWLE